ncbi:MAG: type II toxin-antitoxin system VapC family toxin [Phycisphaerales bacterium]
MIVVDASAAIELVLHGSRAVWVADRVFQPDVVLHAPHLIDLEVSNVLRRVERDDKADVGRVGRAIEAFSAMTIVRHPHWSLLPRVWSLRHNFAAYDASYVALAESLGATLLTCDRRLAAAASRHVRVEAG